MDVGIEKKIIIVLTNISFLKNYGAAQTRLFLYCKALSETGCCILLTSINNDESFQSREQIYSNVYVLGKANVGEINYITQHFAFRKFYLYLKKLFAYTKTIEGNVVYFHYSFTLASVLVSLFYLKLIKKQVLFCEKNELQTGIALNQFIIISPLKFIPTLFLKVIMIISGITQDFMTLFFDGLIVISSNLFKLYRPFRDRIIKIPILTQYEDIILNTSVEAVRPGFFLICYTGEISQKKDGIFDLVKALQLIDIEFKLNLYGNIHYSERKRLHKILNKSNLSEKVILKNSVEQHEIASILCECDLLVLPRPSNLQTRYGFSTKLAEYMMSGVPVLATNVSDNGSVIIDGVTGFLCEPGSVKSISEKINEIYNTPPEIRNEIGVKAKVLAKSKFNVVAYKSQLNDFFEKD